MTACDGVEAARVVKCDPTPMIAPVAYEWIEWDAVKRAHAIDHAGRVACGLPSPRLKDRRRAPDAMPRCTRCLRVVRAHGGED